MTSFIVLGTDTDAGKTTFSLLFLAAFHGHYAYWKPLETGDSDTMKVRRLVPIAQVFEPMARFRDPVAPLLAARREQRHMPTIPEVVAARPHSPLPLVIETFGGPFSPFNESSLQVDLVRAFKLPAVLVGSTTIGAVGRMLAMTRALRTEGLSPIALILMGPPDEFAEERIRHHLPTIPLLSLTVPQGEWTIDSVQEASHRQRREWSSLQRVLNKAGENHLTSETSSVPQLQSEIVTPLQPVTSSFLESALIHRDAEYVWHPYTPLRGVEPPLAVRSAKDEFLHLIDGRRLIDGISSWWTILHGHCEPTIMQALREATASLDHVLFAGATHTHAVAVAERLLKMMPWPAGGRVFFSDNGSTAVEVALKMVYQCWRHRGEYQRTLFLGFEGSYHGDTFGAMAISRDPLFFGPFEPLLFETLRVPVDPQAVDDAFRSQGDRIAAVLIEPLVQGAGGMRMHSPEVLRQIYEIACQHQSLFIADEVMTGFGRTGRMFAFEEAGISPHLVCVAKGLTGGVLPLAATLAAPEVVTCFDTSDRSRTFFHGHSFTANPLACAAAVANLQRLESGDWKQKVDHIQLHLTQELRPLCDLPGVKEVRVRGLIGAVELDLPGGYLASVGPLLRQHCLEEGVMLRPLGPVLYTMPPLCTSDASLERITHAMRGAIERVLSPFPDAAG